jgi:type VI secretion system protein VasD
MNLNRGSVVLMAIASGVLGLTACASKPPKPAPTQALVIASPDVNPDAMGRPSPVVVRIYQLRGDAQFEDAQFFALYDNEQATLGSSLILRDERTLFPGQKVSLDLALSPDAGFLGVAAAYRDLRTARWRAVVGVPEKSLLKLLAKRRVTIKVGKDAVSIAITD